MASHRERMNLNLSEKTEKFLMKEFFYLLHMSGEFWYARGKWYYLSIIHYSLFLLTHFSITSIFLYTTVLLKNYQLSLAAQTLHVGFGDFISLSIFISVAKNRDAVIELATFVSNNFYDYGPSFDTKKVIPWIKELKDFKTKIFKCVLVLYILVGSIALIGGPIIDKIQGTEIKETYINGVYMQTPLPVWLPFRVDSYFVYILVVAYLSLGIMTLLLGLTSGIFLMMYFLHAINTSCRVLNESVANIEKRALFLYKEKHRLGNKKLNEIYEDEDFKAAYEYCIKQNIEHHLIIIRCQAMGNRVQKWPMLVVVFTVSLIIGCALFTVMKGDSRISPQLFSLLLLMQELMVISVICYRGQEMINLSEEFFSSFYRTKWFHCHGKVIKTMMIIQERCKHPLVYRAGGMKEVNWELFGSILNAAYSYFNLMFAMRDSESRDQ